MQYVEKNVNEATGFLRTFKKNRLLCYFFYYDEIYSYENIKKNCMLFWQSFNTTYNFLGKNIVVMTVSPGNWELVI